MPQGNNDFVQNAFWSYITATRDLDSIGHY